MKKIFFTNFFCFCYLLFATSFSIPVINAGDEKVAVTTDPQTARIYVNGVQTGTGSVVVTVGKNDCVKVEVKQEGYIQELRTYCNKKGMTKPPNSDYIQLQADESYTSSTQSDIANKDMLLSVKKGKSKEEAWRSVSTTILNYFDAVETNDEKLGYLRTSWVGQNFKSNTIRTRVIIKQSSEDPIAFKMKFLSEESGRYGTAYSADEQFRPFTRILKKYDGFYEELSTKLAN